MDFDTIQFLQAARLDIALGIVMGCILMSGVINNPVDLTGTASADELLEVEHTRYSRTYKGKIIDDFYSEFENPKIVIEQAGESSRSQETLHGTLDNGEIYVVLNL